MELALPMPNRMEFEVPTLQGVGNSLHRAAMKISLIPARFNQLTLEIFSAAPVKAIVGTFVPGYGKAIALLADPLREMHELALKKHEAVAAGEHPGDPKEHLKNNFDIIRKYGQPIKAAAQAVRAHIFSRTPAAQPSPA